MNSSNQQKIKAQEFNEAMRRYNKYVFYPRIGIFVASAIILLQFITIASLVKGLTASDIKYFFIVLPLAYLMTDFVNGIAHMYMDNNVNYKSVVGPLIAAFHLHHKQPTFRNRTLLQIYFYESGTKWWLLIYLLFFSTAQYLLVMPVALNIFLVAFGILSSVAEVSHYLCHNSTSDQKLITLLQKYYILLPKRHHAKHHRYDNTHYCFLNGVTDPIVNKIAKCLYDGYKNNADQHVMSYNGEQTNNR